MARSVASVLREIQFVESSKYLSAEQKAIGVAPLKEELDALLGQRSLPLPEPPTEAPAGSDTQLAGVRKALK